MLVALHVGRQLVVDHRRQLFHVQATCGHVAGHQHVAAAVGQQQQHFLAVALLHVAMQGERGEAELLQGIRNLVHVLAGVAEHYRRFRRVLQQQARQRLLAVRRFHLAEQVADGRRLIGAFHGHFHRVAQQVTRHGADAVGEGGGEQQALAVLVGAAGDLADRLLEAHVEHAVGFVQHQRAHRAQVQRALACQLLHAAGCADHHMRVMAFQRRQLRAQRHAAHQQQQLQVGDAGGQLADLLADLVGQFAGRAQHQRLHADQAGVDGLQQAQAEGGGLAAAGRRLCDHIAAIQDGRQALRLHGREGGVAEGIQAGLQGRAQRQGREVSHDALYPSGRARLPFVEPSRCSAASPLKPSVGSALHRG